MAIIWEGTIEEVLEMQKATGKDGKFISFVSKKAVRESKVFTPEQKEAITKIAGITAIDLDKDKKFIIVSVKTADMENTEYRCIDLKTLKTYTADTFDGAKKLYEESAVKEPTVKKPKAKTAKKTVKTKTVKKNASTKDVKKGDA